MGSGVVVHELSCSTVCRIFLDRDPTCVPCIGRRILIHCATREVLPCFFHLIGFQSSDHYYLIPRLVEDFPGGSDGKASAYNVGSVPGLGRSLGEGNGNPLQYSCLKNPWTEEPGGLEFMGLHRLRHSLET